MVSQAWKAFLTYSKRTNIGIYPFTGYGYDDDIAASWFRPSNGNCKMEALSYPNRGIFYEFCEVCREGFREKMSKASISTTIYWQDYCKNSTPATANVIAADGSLDYDTLDHTGYKTEFAYTGSAPEDLEKSFIVRHAGKIISNPAITFTYYDSKGNKLDKAPSASGTYTVKVTFKGDYSQFKSMSKTFDIKPKRTSISSLKAAKKGFTVKWKKQTKQIKGYQIQYSTSKSFKSNVKTKTISKSTNLKKITKSSAKRTYYVRVRTYKTVKIGGKDKKLYSSWSTAKKVKTTK